GPEMADQGGVAVWAHVGGFVAGVVLVKLFERRRLVDAKRRKVKLSRQELEGPGWCAHPLRRRRPPSIASACCACRRPSCTCTSTARSARAPSSSSPARREGRFPARKRNRCGGTCT